MFEFTLSIVMFAVPAVLLADNLPLLLPVLECPCGTVEDWFIFFDAFASSDPFWGVFGDDVFSPTAIAMQAFLPSTASGVVLSSSWDSLIGECSWAPVLIPSEEWFPGSFALFFCFSSFSFLSLFLRVVCSGPGKGSFCLRGSGEQPSLCFGF